MHLFAAHPEKGCYITLVNLFSSTSFEPLNDLTWQELAILEASLKKVSYLFSLF